MLGLGVRERTRRRDRAVERTGRWPGAVRVCLVATIVLANLLAIARDGAAHGGDGDERGEVVHTLRAAYGAAQTSSDRDELRDLVTEPIEPGMDADDVMRSRPFIIGDNALDSFSYAETPATAPDEDAARELLRRFLDLRGAKAATIEKALDDYDSAAVKEIVESPTLRASLLMLTDWGPYAATVRAVLEGENPSGEPFRSVEFDDIGFSGAIATLDDSPRDGRHTMVIGRDYEHEHPEQLIPVIVHEALHGGGGNSAEEEIIANILDTISYSEVLAVDPEIAYLGTDLTFFNNIELVALLNSSGRNGPGHVGVATSLLGDVFVGAEFGRFDYESIRDVVEADGFYDALPNEESPGQQTTAALVGRFPGGKALGAKPRYSEEMLAVIDRGVARVIPPDRALFLASHLGLDMVVEVAESGVPPALTSALTFEARPFVPRDLDLFDYRKGRKAPKALTEEGAREALASFLDAAGATPERKATLLARYDDPATANHIPDPALRAATLMLGGTARWSAAIDLIFEGSEPFEVIYADLRHSAPAARRSGKGDAIPAILVNSLWARESPAVLATAIAQGTTLHDGKWTLHEGIASALVGTLVYADVIEIDPAVAGERTLGATSRNRDLLALLNSTAWPGDRPENAERIGVRSAPGETDDILPALYADADSFEDYVLEMPHAARFDRQIDQAAPSVFVSYFAAAGIELTPEFRDKVIYSEKSLAQIDDHLDRVLPAERALRLAETLKLGVARTD